MWLEKAAAEEPLQRFEMNEFSSSVSEGLQLNDGELSHLHPFSGL